MTGRFQPAKMRRNILSGSLCCGCIVILLFLASHGTCQDADAVVAGDSVPAAASLTADVPAKSSTDPPTTTTEAVDSSSTTTNSPSTTTTTTTTTAVSSTTTAATTTTTKRPYNPFLEMAEKQESLIREILSQAFEHLAPQFMRNFYELELSGDCTFGLLKLVFGIKQLRPWAIKVLDASGKIPEGLFYGTLSSFGNFEECLELVARDFQFGQEQDLFNGQYCAVDVKPVLPKKPVRYSPQTYLKNLTDQVPLYKALLGDVSLSYFYFVQIRLGVCTPSLCNHQDVKTLAASVGKLLELNVTVPWCEVKKPMTVDNFQLVSISVLAFFFFLVVLGTSLDVLPRLLESWKTEEIKMVPVKRKTWWLQDIFLAFSAYTNGKRLMTTKTGGNTLAVIHGMRFITMAWIILGHTYFYRNYLLSGGLFQALDLGKDFFFQIVINVFPAVETFVVISGSLLMYTSLQKLDETGGSFNPFIYYFHRYWRLTPAFILVSLLMTLLPLLGSGPVWNETLLPYAEACRKNWWTNPLYIGTWIRREEMCLPHGWYLSCDMQYYIIAPLLFLLIFKLPRLGFFVLFLGGLASMVTVGVLTYLWEYPPIPLFVDPDPDHFNDFMSYIGYRPYTHFTPFCIGMAVGYVLYKYKNIRMSRIMRLLGWFVSGMLTLTVLFGVYNWNAYEPPNLTLAVLYAATSRTAWALGVAWMIVACASGNGGFINVLLSWKAFIPLSRLTFLVYLIHPLLILLHTAYLRKPFYFTQFFALYLYFGHLLVAYCLSFTLTVTFESPFMILERKITNRLRCGIFGDRRKSMDVNRKSLEKDEVPNHKGNDFVCSVPENECKCSSSNGCAANASIDNNKSHVYCCHL